MHYIPLGDTALRVSRLCLGCMTFGEPDRGRHAWTLPEESSRPLIQHAIEGGINFFDTANSYSDGSSEEIVGRALRDFARRDEVVVATKVYHQVGDLAEELDASRAQVALAWLLSKPGVAAPIIGPSRQEQLDDLLQAVDLTLSPEQIDKLEAPYQPHPVVGFK
ncbi:aldo/keto reductase [Klebsiella pneumoniae]